MCQKLSDQTENAQAYLQLFEGRLQTCGCGVGICRGLTSDLLRPRPRHKALLEIITPRRQRRLPHRIMRNVPIRDDEAGV